MYASWRKFRRHDSINFKMNQSKQELRFGDFEGLEHILSCLRSGSSRLELYWEKPERIKAAGLTTVPDNIEVKPESSVDTPTPQGAENETIPGEDQRSSPVAAVTEGTPEVAPPVPEDASPETPLQIVQESPDSMSKTSPEPTVAPSIVTPPTGLLEVEQVSATPTAALPSVPSNNIKPAESEPSQAEVRDIVSQRRETQSDEDSANKQTPLNQSVVNPKTNQESAQLLPLQRPLERRNKKRRPADYYKQFEMVETVPPPAMQPMANFPQAASVSVRQAMESPSGYSVAMATTPQSCMMPSQYGHPPTNVTYPGMIPASMMALQHPAVQMQIQHQLQQQQQQHYMPAQDMARVAGMAVPGYPPQHQHQLHHQQHIQQQPHYTQQHPQEVFHAQQHQQEVFHAQQQMASAHMNMRAMPPGGPRPAMSQRGHSPSHALPVGRSPPRGPSYVGISYQGPLNPDPPLAPQSSTQVPFNVQVSQMQASLQNITFNAASSPNKFQKDVSRTAVELTGAPVVLPASTPEALSPVNAACVKPAGESVNVHNQSPGETLQQPTVKAKGEQNETGFTLGLTFGTVEDIATMQKQSELSYEPDKDAQTLGCTSEAGLPVSGETPSSSSQIFLANAAKESGHEVVKESGYEAAKAPGHEVAKESGHEVAKESGHEVAEESGHEVAKEPSHEVAKPAQVSPESKPAVVPVDTSKLPPGGVSKAASLADANKGISPCGSVKVGPTHTGSTTGGEATVLSSTAPEVPPVVKLAEAPQPVKVPARPCNWSDLFKKDTTSKPSPGIVVSEPRGPVKWDKTPTSLTEPKEEEPRKPVEASKDSSAKDLGDKLLKYTLNYQQVSLQPRGLYNEANWCYINATLQALLACPPFYHLMKMFPTFQNQKRGPSSTPVTDCLVEFVNEFNEIAPVELKLERTGNKGPSRNILDVRSGPPFVPKNVYKMLQVIDYDVSFKHGRQEDAEEFLGCMLNALHDEMVASMTVARGNSPGGEDGISENGDMSCQGSRDATEDDDDQWEQVGPKNKSVVTRSAKISKSPISALFGGQIRSILHQQGLKESATLQPFFTLQLDVQQKEVGSVTEALETLVSKESIQGFTDSNTKQEVEATRRIMLEELPPVLILHIKCFVYDKSGGCQKVIKPIDFPIDLNISKDLLSPNAKSKHHKSRDYRLFAVVNHHGVRAIGGHYTADVYHSGISSWIHSDDRNIKVVSPAQVLQFAGPKVPYLLYYRRKDLT